MRKKCKVVLFIIAIVIFLIGVDFGGMNFDRNSKCSLCMVKNEKQMTNNIYVICLCDNVIITIDLDNISYGIKNDNEIIHTLDLRKHYCKYKNDIIIEKCEQNRTIKIVNISTNSSKKISKDICSNCIEDFCIDKSEKSHIIVSVPEICTFYTKQKNNKKFEKYEIIFV